MATATRTTAPQIGLIRLSDLPDGDGFHRSWVMVLPEGTYQHDEFGAIDLTRPVLDEIIRNFDERARGIDIALDYDHKAKQGDSKAPGWIERVQYRPALGAVPAGLWAQVRWTEIGLHDVKGQLYRYLSAEFKPTYTNDITGKTYGNTLLGLTLTNRPYMKHMPAITLSEVSTKAWSSVNKSMLPRSCFLIQGDPDERSTWKLPIYEAAGNVVGGVFEKRGKLNIHGVKAALGAIHGARSGKAMSGVPAGTVKRLESLLAKYSQSGDKQSDSAGDGGGMGMADLNDMSLYEDEAASARYELADTKKQAKGKIVDKNTPEDDNEDAEGMEYDDAEDDTTAMDDEGDGEEYAEEDADGADADIDHLPAKQRNNKAVKGKGSKQMSESDGETLTLAEATRQLAEVRHELYEAKADKILLGFESGTFQFMATEAKTRSKNGQPLGTAEVKRSGQFRLAPRAQRALREWLHSETAFQLSEGERTRFLSVIEQVIKGVVDLSVRGSSHDMEREKTVVSKSPTYRPASKPEERDRLLAEAAAEIAVERGKDIAALRLLQRQVSREGIEAANELQSIYALAERRIEASITAAE